MATEIKPSGNKPGFLTEADGKPSSTRLATVFSVFLAFALIIAQAVVSVAAFFQGLSGTPDIAQWDILVLLFGFGGFNVAANRLAQRK